MGAGCSAQQMGSAVPPCSRARCGAPRTEGAGMGVPDWAPKGCYALRALETPQQRSTAVLIKAENCL